MLRSEVKARTPLGLEAKRYLDAGDLIPDEVILAMVASRLDRDDTRSRGFLLDGFPRTVAQADGFDDLLKPDEVDLVLNLVVPTELVLARLMSRRVCEDCGAIYSTVTPPKLNWICDICGGEVVQREDDTEEAIKNRLALYDSSTAPLIERYAALGKLVDVSGVGHPDEISRVLTAVIDAYQHGGSFFPPVPPEDRL
jgi:adenylate kinase